MVPSSGDRRHDAQQVGVLLFGRFYSLGKIGGGVILMAAVAGVIGGCFAATANVLALKTGPGAATVDELRKMAVAALNQSRANEKKIDTLVNRQDQFERLLRIVASGECGRMRRSGGYVPEDCDTFAPVRAR